MSFRRITLLFLVLLSASISTSNAEDSSTELASKAKYYGEVVFFRGGFNVFSRGLDEMAEKLEKNGVKVRVAQHTEADAIAAEVIANWRKRGRKPVVLVGHSWGANALIRVAEKLREKRIRVNYAATFAATDPDPAPSNIRKLTNYYFKKDGWGEKVTTVKGFRGVLKNIDVSKNKKIHHFNIEKQSRLQNQVINNVLRVLGVRRLG